MPDDARSGWRRLSPARSLVVDLLHFGADADIVFREMNLSRLAAARGRCAARVSWVTLFMRAYALLSIKRRVLRQTWMPLPLPHLYEYPQTACMVAVRREHRGEDRLFFGLFRSPEERGLEPLQKRLDAFKHGEIETTHEYRWQLRLAMWPGVLRRMVWRVALYVSGRVRVRHLGTFAITTVGGQGATIVHAPTVQTTLLSMGPMNEAGVMRVTVCYDHRVVDAGTLADVLAELERTLNGEMVEELDAMTGVVGGVGDGVRTG